MTTFLRDLISKLESEIRKENGERGIENLPDLPFLEIVLLGQIGLLVRKELADALPLFATSDLDAWISREWESKRILKEALASFGLHLDPLSKEIWMPNEAKKDLLYESSLLRIEVFDATDILTSKAVKALDRNLFLIQHALQFFGPKLEEKLRVHGVDIKRLKKG